MTKLMSFISCAMLALNLFSTVPSVNPLAEVCPCPECEIGTVSRHVSRAYQHDETFRPCTHGGNGYDVYAVYEVSEVESCNKCMYRYEYNYEEHILRYCTSK